MMKKTGIKAFDIKVFWRHNNHLLFSRIFCFYICRNVEKRCQACCRCIQRTFEMLLNSLFHKTDVVEAIVLANNGELSQSVFENVAKSLFDGDGIRAVQYLPGGIVEYCYPLQGNEAVIGSSVFNDPKRRKDALLALETRETALSGPYNLTQGGFGLIEGILFF